MGDDMIVGPLEGVDGTPAWAYDADGYCVCCGNGRWKPHMPDCRLRDALDALAAVVAAAREVAGGGDTDDGMVEVKWDEMIRLRDALDALERSEDEHEDQDDQQDGDEAASDVHGGEVPVFEIRDALPEVDRALAGSGPAGKAVAAAMTAVAGFFSPSALRAAVLAEEDEVLAEEDEVRRRSRLAAGVLFVPAQPKCETCGGRRVIEDPACVKRWPECTSFGYDPRCCRFPKSCSSTRGCPECAPW